MLYDQINNLMDYSNEKPTPLIVSVGGWSMSQEEA